MTGVTIKEEMNTDASYCSIAKERRKRMKVAVERRRRDRINRALESLRHLLAENSLTDVEADQVIDKAVILEKTVELLQRNRSTSPQGVPNQGSTFGEHYSSGYGECIQQIDLATSRCTMDVHLKSRLLQHLSQSTNVRMVPYTKRSSLESLSPPESPLYINSSVRSAFSPSAIQSRSPSTSPVHSNSPQFYINTNSPPQESGAHPGKFALSGLLRNVPSLQVPANPEHQRQDFGHVQEVDENNNVINPVMPGPVSSPMWRPW